MLRLKTLKAKACRGIVDGPPLEFESGGLILCGDNGTGKSSFIDALEKVLAGSCGSLDISAQGISWEKQGQNVLSSKPPEVELVITDGNKEKTLTLDTDYETMDKGVKAFIHAAKQQSFILRRRTLLKYIDAKPAERWQAIEEFLRLQEFNDFEGCLRDLAQETKTHLKIVNDEVAQKEKYLREKLKMDFGSQVNEVNCLFALNKLISEFEAQPVKNLQELDSRITSIKRELAQFAKIKSVELLLGLKAKAETIPCPTGILNTGEAYTKIAKATEEETAKLTGLFFDDVLRRGREWIEKGELEACPLCGSTISRDQVIAEIDKRLSQNTRLTDLRTELAFAQKEFVTALAGHILTLQAVKAAWTAIGGDFPLGADQALSALSEAHKVHEKLRPSATTESCIAEIAAIHLDTTTIALKNMIQGQLDTFPSMQQYKRLMQTLDNFIILKDGMDSLITLKEQVSFAEYASVSSARVVDLAEKARKKAVQELVDSVAVLANRYLLRIHPTDGIHNAKLTVPDRGAASLTLSNEFFGVKGDPRGHYSEGHVDSLGLCLFLAIRRLHFTQKPELAILVLDDVLHSVDGEHRRATADLIFDEFKDHQIIITTHDPLWFENLKAAEQKHSGGKQFTHYRIANWDVSTGPMWGDHKSDYEWLLSADGVAAKPSDRAVKAGRLLEEMLRNLCHTLTISVPYRMTGDYTIDPLWASFLPKARKNKTLQAAIGKHLDDIDDLRAQRNWVGAHWNEWALCLTDKESKEFANAVVTLRKAVYCPSCRQFIQRVAHLDGVWSCMQECLRYDINIR